MGMDIMKIILKKTKKVNTENKTAERQPHRQTDRATDERILRFVDLKSGQPNSNFSFENRHYLSHRPPNFLNHFLEISAKVLLKMDNGVVL